jgi:DNA ligase 1
MRTFAQTCDRVAATSKKLEKIRLVAEYLSSIRVAEAVVTAVFLSGRPFPIWEETTLNVGGALLWRVVEELSAKTDGELSAAYRRHGDLGAVAGELLPALPPTKDLMVSEVQAMFRKMAAARGPAAKGALVRELLTHVPPLEAKYIIKIMTGDLRIGLKESLLEEAIAKAFGSTLSAVQRANMLLGDIGQTLELAAANQLHEAKMRLFHPLGFMLASPAESAEAALSYFRNAYVEDKYDGIRAQVHCSGAQVKIFSRTRDDITESFPELPVALAGFPADVILDGEIVAWSYLTGEANEPGRALPFSALQQRLGRKKVRAELMRQVPVAYLVFDLLYSGDELLLERSLRERTKLLDSLLSTDRRRVAAPSRESQAELAFSEAELPATARVMRAPLFQASSPRDLDQLFEAAQARGNEGLMIKDPESRYTPGRRGKSWLKLKRELATLDVVVTAVEYGHGKRIGVLSDYTFAVRDGDRLVNIGKAYSGLTDAEIMEMTKWFLEHTIKDEGFRLMVEPKIVLEVAFNNMMRSDRHTSGYALRFPRIVRLRPDKPPEEVDTIERVGEIYQRQHS